MRRRAIHLENLTKVFTTHEVETHALSGVHLDEEGRPETVVAAAQQGS